VRGQSQLQRGGRRRVHALVAQRRGTRGSDLELEAPLEADAGVLRGVAAVFLLLLLLLLLLWLVLLRGGSGGGVGGAVERPPPPRLVSCCRCQSMSCACTAFGGGGMLPKSLEKKICARANWTIKKSATTRRTGETESRISPAHRGTTSPAA
jgi:hypothetical protein